MKQKSCGNYQAAQRKQEATSLNHRFIKPAYDVAYDLVPETD